jgi:imidazolonepropionase-like amidohydrolase
MMSATTRLRRCGSRCGPRWASLLAGFPLISTVAVAQTSPVPQSDRVPYTIVADAYVDAGGEIVPGAVLAVSGEKIAALGGDSPTGNARHEYPGATLCPGLIDCYAALSAFGNLSEVQSALQPAAEASDAFDRFHPQLRRALEAGVTTFALVPRDDNVIGGQAAICQTSGPRGRPAVLRDDGPLMLSISPAVLRVDRDPTSRSGAIGMLRDALERAAGGAADSPALAAAAGGKLPAFLSAPSGADVLSALDLARTGKLRLVLVHTRAARDVAREVKDALGGVVVGPLGLNPSPRDAAAAALFEQAGVKTAIAGGLPAHPAESLRIGAAVAVRSGMSAAAARRAITTVPAELLGVADQVGSLKPETRADVVVFSGDPLDLRSRVLAVYVGGRRVYLSPPAESSNAER